MIFRFLRYWRRNCFAGGVCIFYLFWIEDEDLRRAREIARGMGALKGSITGGEGNLAGAIGELKLLEYLGLDNVEVKRTFDYDMILVDTFKIDVKTKRTTVPFVEKSYEASVADFNTEQDCHYYVFARVNLEKRIGWLLGCISPKLYYKHGRFLKKGQRDGSNDFIVKADCWNMRYDQLYSMERMKLWL